MPVRRGESLLYRQNHAYLALHRRLAKKAGVPVYTYKIEGAYFAHPRWAKYLRRGKVTGQLVNKYTPEQLKEMPVDAVNAIF